MLRTAALIIACAVLLPPFAFAAGPAARIVEYGIYATERSGAVIKKEKTASGRVTPVRSHKLLKRTNEVFGQLGKSFGIEIDLSGMPVGAVTLTIRTLHPPLTNPATGRTTQVSDYDWTVVGRKKLYFGFSFDHRWELAEGVWTKQILYTGKLLAEQKFNVRVPLN
jgi:hypothetical protein